MLVTNYCNYLRSVYWSYAESKRYPTEFWMRQFSLLNFVNLWAVTHTTIYYFSRSNDFWTLCNWKLQTLYIRGKQTVWQFQEKSLMFSKNVRRKKETSLGQTEKKRYTKRRCNCNGRRTMPNNWTSLRMALFKKNNQTANWFRYPDSGSESYNCQDQFLAYLSAFRDQGLKGWEVFEKNCMIGLKTEWSGFNCLR